MKLAKTMLEANILLPSVRPVTRNQRVSNRTPAAPEKKKIKDSSSGNLKTPPVVSRMTPRIGQAYPSDVATSAVDCQSLLRWCLFSTAMPRLRGAVRERGVDELPRSRALAQIEGYRRAFRQQ